jgi:hypothetical protein
VSVEVDLRTLEGLPITDAADAATRRCQLADGTPIARSTVERLLCTCKLTAIAAKLAVAGEIEVVGITDWIRDATAKQRKALKKRDLGYVSPAATPTSSGAKPTTSGSTSCSGPTLRGPSGSGW